MAIQSASRGNNVTFAGGPVIGGGSGLSVCFWVQVAQPASPQTSATCGFDQGGSELLPSHDPNTPDIRMVYNAEGNTLINSHVPAANTWYYVAYTYNGTNVAIHTKFIGEGSLTSQSASDGTDSFTPTRLWYPQSPSGTYEYNGGANPSTTRITNVKIWNSVLTTPQLLTESTKYNPQIATWAWYKCVSAATANTDSSGNGRTGTINGSLTDFTDPTGVWDDLTGNVVAWLVG